MQPHKTLLPKTEIAPLALSQTNVCFNSLLPMIIRFGLVAAVGHNSP